MGKEEEIILKMVKDRQVTAEQGAELLKALRPSPGSGSSAGGKGDASLGNLVNDFAEALRERVTSELMTVLDAVGAVEEGRGGKAKIDLGKVTRRFTRSVHGRIKSELTRALRGLRPDRRGGSLAIRRPAPQTLEPFGKLSHEQELDLDGTKIVMTVPGMHLLVCKGKALAKPVLKGDGPLDVKVEDGRILVGGDGFGQLVLSDAVDELDLSYEAGSVWLNEIECDATVSAMGGGSENGDVRLSDCKGTMSIATTAGNVEIDKFSGALTTSTRSGDQHLVKIDLEDGGTCSSASGDVLFDDLRVQSGCFAATTSSGTLAATRCDAAELSLQSASGSVIVKDSHGALLVMESISGDVSGQAVGFARLEAVSRSGDLRLVGVSGDVSLRSTSGDVMLEKLERGTLSVSSVSGDVSVEGAELLAGDHELRSNSGDLELVDVASPDGLKVTWKTVSGRMTNRRDKKGNDHPRGGESEGAGCGDPNGKARLSLKTVSGDLTLH